MKKIITSYSLGAIANQLTNRPTGAIIYGAGPLPE